MGGCRGPGGLIASLGQLRRPLPKVHARAVCLRGRFTGLPPCTLCARPRSGVRFGVDPRTCVRGGPCARSGAPHPTLAIGGASATRIHACILTPCRNLCVHAGPLHGGCAAAATPFAGGVQPSGGAWKSLRGLSDASRNECTMGRPLPTVASRCGWASARPGLESQATTRREARRARTLLSSLERAQRRLGPKPKRVAGVTFVAFYARSLCSELRRCHLQLSARRGVPMRRPSCPSGTPRPDVLERAKSLLETHK